MFECQTPKYSFLTLSCYDPGGQHAHPRRPDMHQSDTFPMVPGVRLGDDFLLIGEFAVALEAMSSRERVFSARQRAGAPLMLHFLVDCGRRFKWSLLSK
jgi:hypothetical protein